MYLFQKKIKLRGFINLYILKLSSSNMALVRGPRAKTCTTNRWFPLQSPAQHRAQPTRCADAKMRPGGATHNDPLMLWTTHGPASRQDAQLSRATDRGTRIRWSCGRD